MERIVVGISGASGTPLACRLMRQLKNYTDLEVHAVVSQGARITAGFEAPEAFAELEHMVDRLYDNDAIGSSIASGTFRTKGMIIVPCSMKTAAGIATGYSDNLLLRAADVTLKEQRPLVLVARETPMSALHLRNLATLAALPGVSIVPPMLTYYHDPQSIEDMEDQIIGKIFDRIGLNYPPLSRWKN